MQFIKCIFFFFYYQFIYLFGLGLLLAGTAMFEMPTLQAIVGVIGLLGVWLKSIESAKKRVYGTIRVGNNEQKNTTKRGNPSLGNIKKEEINHPESKHNENIVVSSSRNEIRISVGTSHGYEEESQIKEHNNSSWYGLGDTLEIHGFKIKDPFLYVINSKGKCELNFLVSTKLKATLKGSFKSMDYWPSYSEMSATNRGYFLKWLEDGKKDPDVDTGLLFIYFYGLEHKVLNEKKDYDVILAELLRIYEIYHSSSSSFEGYCAQLISLVMDHVDIEIARKANELINRLSPSSWRFNHYCKELGFPENSKPKAEDIINSVPLDYETTRSKIPGKVGKPFTEYFTLINRDLINLALERASVKQKSERYDSAIGWSAFQIEESYIKTYELKIPGHIKSDLSKAWKEAVEAFRPYSRAIGKKTDAALFDLLPAELRGEKEHPLEKSILEFVDKNEMKLVKISELHEVAGNNKKLKYSAKENADVGKSFRSVGVSIEPDFEYFRKTRKGEEQVIISRTEIKGPIEGDEYKLASLLCDFGIDIGNSDGEFLASEKSSIYDFIAENFITKEVDKTHLKMRLTLYKEDTPKLGNVYKRLTDNLGISELKLFTEFMMRVALADGVICAKEDDRIRKTLSKLGFEKGYVSDLYSKFGISEEEILLKKGTGTSEKGSSIPKKEAFNLDRDLLKDLEGETALVKEELSKIMIDDEEEVVSLEPVVAEDLLPEIPSIPTLDEKHKALFDVIVTKSEWSKNDLREKAKDLGLMVNSAISKINDWAEEELGDYIVFDEEHYVIQLELLEGARESA